MIDIVERMSPIRAEFIKYCTEVLKPESVLWIKRLFSNINKKTLVDRDDEFVVRVWPMYKNILHFVQDFVDEPSPGSILATLYISGIELGILELGDEVEQLEDFTSYIDMDDWANVTTESVVKFDLYTEAVLVSRLARGNSDDGDGVVVAAGLRTLSLLDFVTTE